MAKLKELRLQVEGSGEVSALLNRPANARRILALAHGAGAGMSHPFMESLSGKLAEVGIATLRYQFPYMEAQRRVPDAPAVLTATVAAAVRTASEAASSLPLLAGGKSMGGRMTSQAAAEGLLEGRVRRPGIAASDRCKARAASHASRHRRRGSFVPRPEKVRKNRHRHFGGTGGNDFLVERQVQCPIS
jgi:hypothetical protein